MPTQAQLSAQPVRSGCAIVNVAATPGQRLWPTKPFANFAYDNFSVGTNPTVFALAMREVALRRIIIQTSSTGITDFPLDILEPDGPNNVVYSITVDPTGSDWPSARVIEFPGEGLRFDHGIGIDSTVAAVGLQWMVVYDWIY